MSDQGGFPQQCSTQGCSGNPPQLKFYQAFTFATPIIFTLVLLLLFCVLYVRRRQTARAVSQLRAQFFARGLFSAWPIDHGLTKSFRATLPTIVFDENFAASHEDNQCAVCLSDYQVGEKLQQLPVCDHVFHVECIDEWLASNATCPICRTSLLQVGKLVPLETIQTTTAGSTSEAPQIRTETPGNSASSPSPVTGAPASSLEAPASSSAEISHHKSTPSMEDTVKDSAVERVIQIER